MTTPSRAAGRSGTTRPTAAAATAAGAAPPSASASPPAALLTPEEEAAKKALKAAKKARRLAAETASSPGTSSAASAAALRAAEAEEARLRAEKKAVKKAAKRAAAATATAPDTAPRVDHATAAPASPAAPAAAVTTPISPAAAPSAAAPAASAPAVATAAAPSPSLSASPASSPPVGSVDGASVSSPFAFMSPLRKASMGEWRPTTPMADMSLGAPLLSPARQAKHLRDDSTAAAGGAQAPRIPEAELASLSPEERAAVLEREEKYAQEQSDIEQLAQSLSISAHALDYAPTVKWVRAVATAATATGAGEGATSPLQQETIAEEDDEGEATRPGASPSPAASAASPPSGALTRSPSVVPGHSRGTSANSRGSGSLTSALCAVSASPLPLVRTLTLSNESASDLCLLLVPESSAFQVLTPQPLYLPYQAALEVAVALAALPQAAPTEPAGFSLKVRVKRVTEAQMHAHDAPAFWLATRRRPYARKFVLLTYSPVEAARDPRALGRASERRRERADQAAHRDQQWADESAAQERRRLQDEEAQAEHQRHLERLARAEAARAQREAQARQAEAALQAETRAALSRAAHIREDRIQEKKRAALARQASAANAALITGGEAPARRPARSSPPHDAESLPSTPRFPAGSSSSSPGDADADAALWALVNNPAAWMRGHEDAFRPLGPAVWPPRHTPLWGLAAAVFPDADLEDAASKRQEEQQQQQHQQPYEEDDGADMDYAAAAGEQHSALSAAPSFPSSPALASLSSPTSPSLPTRRPLLAVRVMSTSVPHGDNGGGSGSHRELAPVRLHSASKLRVVEEKQNGATPYSPSARPISAARGGTGAGAASTRSPSHRPTSSVGGASPGPSVALVRALTSSASSPALARKHTATGVTAGLRAPDPRRASSTLQWMQAHAHSPYNHSSSHARSASCTSAATLSASTRIPLPSKARVRTAHDAGSSLRRSGAAGIDWMQIMFSESRNVRGYVDALYHILSRPDQHSHKNGNASGNGNGAASAGASLLSAEGICLPDTIVFRDGRPMVYYYTGSAGEVREKSWSRIAPAKALQRFEPALLLRGAAAVAPTVEDVASVATLLVAAPAEPAEMRPEALPYADVATLLQHESATNSDAPPLLFGNMILQQCMRPAPVPLPAEGSESGSGAADSSADPSAPLYHELYRSSWSHTAPLVVRRRWRTNAAVDDTRVAARDCIVHYEHSTPQSGDGMEEESLAPSSPVYRKLARVTEAIVKQIAKLAAAAHLRPIRVSIVFQRGAGAATGAAAPQWYLLYADQLKLANLVVDTSSAMQFAPEKQQQQQQQQQQSQPQSPAQRAHSGTAAAGAAAFAVYAQPVGSAALTLPAIHGAADSPRPHAGTSSSFRASLSAAATSSSASDTNSSLVQQLRTAGSSGAVSCTKCLRLLGPAERVERILAEVLAPERWVSGLPYATPTELREAVAAAMHPAQTASPDWVQHTRVPLCHACAHGSASSAPAPQTASASGSLSPAAGRLFAPSTFGTAL